MLIAGNAGHYPGLDSGAVGPNGLTEAFVVDDITRKFLKFLEDAGYQTLFIQENSLAAICKKANDANVDLFISIHCNGFTNPSANGMEIYTTTGNTQADPLATCIMEQLQKSEPTNKLAVRADWSDGDVDKEVNYYVLYYTKAPAVLVETAFITNPDEEAMLSDENNRTKIAAAIARGVTDYLSKK